MLDVFGRCQVALLGALKGESVALPGMVYQSNSSSSQIVVVLKHSYHYEWAQPT